MNITWFSKNISGLVTIYDTNITLNTVASNHFKNAYATLIGFDSNSDTLLIKAISKEEVTMGLYSEDDIHQISIKASYGRINGKGIIKNLCLYFPLDFKTVPSHKFECVWVNEEKTLKIDLKKEVK